MTQQTPTQEQYDDAKAYIREFLQEKYPNLSLDPTSVLHDLLIEPGAELAALNEANMDAIIRSGSLLEINKDPEGADPVLVDRVLSNWGVVRQDGAKASGQLTLVFSSSSTVVVAAGAEFLAAGLQFLTERSFISTLSEAVGENESKMVARSDGTYACVIDVIAGEEGTSYNIPKNTTAAWEGAPAGFITAFATVDFSGGVGSETNSELIAKQQDGIAVKTMGGRNNIRSMLRDRFPEIVDMEIIGMRDKEMNRDSNNVFGFKIGGKVDIYVRTSEMPLTTRHTLPGLLVNADEGLFVINIAREVCRGCYAVDGVFPLDGDTSLTGLELYNVSYGLDTTSDGEFTPEIEEATAGYFSKYQTMSVTVRHPDADTTGMTEMESTLDFQVDLLGLPSIVELQDTVSDREIRHPAGDYLIRAAFPVLVAVNLEVTREASDGEVDVEALVSAVVARINALPMGYGKLPASIVIDAAQTTLSGLSSVRSPIEMTGVLVDPSVASNPRLRSSHELTVPVDYALGRSPRTAAFYTSAASINVKVVAASSLV
jgi:hypothetical protein